MADYNGKVCGVGINTCKGFSKDSDLNSIYNMWSSMLDRCYKTARGKDKPVYHDVTVCDEWLYFEEFKNWVLKQGWKGKQLDKDLLSGNNKRYSPSTCLFVTAEVNTCITLGNSVNSNSPIGVTESKDGYFQSKCGTRKTRGYIGTYKTAKEAHVRWQMVKCEVIEKVISKQKDVRVKEALRAVVKKIRTDFRNGLETTSLL